MAVTNKSIEQHANKTNEFTNIAFSENMCSSQNGNGLVLTTKDEKDKWRIRLIYEYHDLMNMLYSEFVRYSRDDFYISTVNNQTLIALAGSYVSFLHNLRYEDDDLLKLEQTELISELHLYNCGLNKVQRNFCMVQSRVWMLELNKLHQQAKTKNSNREVDFIASSICYKHFRSITYCEDSKWIFSTFLRLSSKIFGDV